MSTNISQVYYKAIQQASFELEDLIGLELAADLRSRLIETLQTESGDPTPEQITKALEMIQPYKPLRERIRGFVENERNVRLGFDTPPGEATWVGDPPGNARLLICPVDGEKMWDIPLRPGERRLCLKHRVFYTEAGPLDQYKNSGG